MQADGTVLVEGSQGITLDAKSADLTMKAKAITMNATQGVQLDGGSGAVQMKTNGTFDVEGLSVGIKGKTTTKVEGGATTMISGAMVKIN